MAVGSMPAMEDGKNPDRRVQLDGMRCFAVAGAMWAHWVPKDILLPFPWGFCGLQLFFVMSGFLITRQLVRARDAAPGTLGAWRTFYARRVLRIFPAYYLYLAVSIATDVGPGRKLWVWLLTYTQNLLVFTRQEHIGYMSHLWSLGVEEQFYLLWPFVVLLLPRRWLRTAVLLAVLLAPVTRLAMYLAWGSLRFEYEMPLTCLDGLGIGAFLAVLAADGDDPERWTSRWFWPALISYVALEGMSRFGIETFNFAKTTAMVLVMASWVWSGWNGRLPGFLSWRPFVWVGQVSYGVYLWHMFARGFVGFDLPKVLRIPAYLAVTLVVAWASHRFVERPIGNLKRFVPWPGGSRVL
jgi:peptidoglycan/LPS O-acetylase OafA/YrhL